MPRKSTKSESQAQLLGSHELSKLFPLLVGDDIKTLAADIQTHGLHEPITLYEGQILDGRNRYRACLRAKIKPTFKTFKGTREQARDYVVSANIVRRHLTAKQKRDLIRTLLKANPAQSDRQIAEKVKVSHPHVGKVRAEMEKAGDVETVSTSTDTKGRKQPRQRTSKATEEILQSDKTIGADGKARRRRTTSKPGPTIDASQTGIDSGLNAGADAPTTVGASHSDLGTALPPSAAEAKAQALQDVGPRSQSELERLRVRVNELEAAKRLLEIKTEGLESEISELKDPSLLDALNAALAVVDQTKSEPGSAFNEAIAALRLALREVLKLSTEGISPFLKRQPEKVH